MPNITLVPLSPSEGGKMQYQGPYPDTNFYDVLTTTTIQIGDLEAIYVVCTLNPNYIFDHYHIEYLDLNTTSDYSDIGINIYGGHGNIRVSAFCTYGAPPPPPPPPSINWANVLQCLGAPLAGLVIIVVFGR